MDTHEGHAYIGVIPFLMRKVRPRFLFSVPGISNFLELNLRTYVTDNQGRKGVWFYSLDANQHLAVFIARTLFFLPYHFARMHYTVNTGRWITFSSQRPRSETQKFRFKQTSPALPAETNSLTHFLVERYLLFSYHSKKDRIFAGRVRHQPYRVSSVQVSDYSKALFSLNGLTAPEGPPDHMAFAEPVDVDIYPLEQVPRTPHIRSAFGQAIQAF